MLVADSEFFLIYINLEKSTRAKKCIKNNVVNGATYILRLECEKCIFKSTLN